MRSTDDYNFDDVSSMNALLPFARKNYDPQQEYAASLLKKETSHPLGIVTKAISGALMADRGAQVYQQAAQKQQQEMAERQRIGQILQTHEEKGLDEDFTFKSLLDEYARSGSKVALNIATRLKPRVSNNPDSITQLDKLARTKRNYLIGKGLEFADEKQLTEMSKTDPALRYFDDEINKIIGAGQMDPGQGASDKNLGGRQEIPEDHVGSYNDLQNFNSNNPGELPANAGIETMAPTPGGVKTLSQQQLADQNRKNSGSLDRDGAVKARIQELRSKKIDDRKIGSFLRQKGLDPKRYGVNG